jgi:hypothetical protein
MVCKLSIIISGSKPAGAILDAPGLPNIGDEPAVGNSAVAVLEVMELLAPRGEFRFIQVICKLLSQPARQSGQVGS